LDNFIFDFMETHDYENILFCQEKTLGLKVIIAIHDSQSELAIIYQRVSSCTRGISKHRVQGF